jgi:hypothetical protein
MDNTDSMDNTDNMDNMDNKEEKKDKEWFVAVDPGKVNFAFIIEEIDKDMLKDITCPLKKDRFIKNGKKDISPTDSYTNFLEEFYHCGRTILCSNNDITCDACDACDVSNEEEKEPKKRRKKGEKGEKGEEKKEKKTTKKRGSKTLDSNVFLRLTNLLDKHKEYFDKCSTIIIEQQMSFGSKINTMAIKIAQHTYSYFLFRYGNAKKIIEFPSYNKTQILGAPSGLDKPQRKKWAIEKANEIWTMRGDLDTIDMIGTKKKKDDMSDCLLHVLAYIIHNNY